MSFKAPNFFVIGVVKGGTTSLYHYLDQHPDIYVPPVKETNHFAAADIDPAHFLQGYAQDVEMDLDRYIARGMKEQVHIAHVNEPAHYAALFSKVEGQKAVGEISNSYMVCPSAAAAIYAAYPEARLLVILRNPIGRAWSQYLMNLREAKEEAGSFIEALQRDASTTYRGWGVNHQYLELGKYASQLAPYIERFGPTQICPVFFEAYRASPANVMAEVCRFLGVDEQFVFNFETERNKASLPRNPALNRFLVRTGAVKTLKRVFPRSIRQKMAGMLYTDKSLPSMSEADRQWLRNYYQEEVDALVGLIGAAPYAHWPEFKPT